jgi:ABC-type branched-subunit amino acid transport system ATPase component
VIDYLQKGQTITGECSASVLEGINQRKVTKKAAYRGPSAAGHKVQVAMATAVCRRFKILLLVQYSTGLAPSDDFPFSKIEIGAVVAISEMLIMSSMLLEHTYRHKMHHSSIRD